MRKKILLLLMTLGLCFGTLNATEDCSEIEVVAVQETLQSYSTSESETVEVVIHNPDYCLSKITDISLSDSENFELDLDFGAVPCGSDDFSMRGYQFCTVGVTFKPVTSSGDFETEVRVSTVSAPVACATVKGDVVICDECQNDDDDDDDDECGNCGHGGHGNCGHGGHGHGNMCGKGHGRGGHGNCGHGGHGNMCGKGHGRGGHGNMCRKGHGHGEHGSCNHRHNRWCGYDRGHGTCGHQHNRRCGGMKNGDGGHGNMCGKGHGHGGHGNCGHGGHGNMCGKGHGHGGHGSCNHRHNRWCGYDRGRGMCGHQHNRWCGYEEDDDNDDAHTCPPLAPVKKLVDEDATNYINCLNLINPTGTSVVEVYDDIVYFNDYNEKEVGLATFELDSVVDFTSMLTFTATVDEGLFMPRISGDDGEYMTTDVRVTKQYGFIFPDNFDLTELNFTTWGRSFTGAIEDLSVTEVTNDNLLD